MKLRHAAAIAVLVLTACGPDMAAINAASERAEAAASRAEIATEGAEAQANGAFKSCYKINRTLIKTEQPVERAKDYVESFGEWEKLRRLPLHSEPSWPKPGTVLPDGSIAASSLDALAASPNSWNEADTLDPRDREDDDHATAVMNCHPELDSLPGFGSKTISADVTGEAKTKDGRDITVILVWINDTDPKSGAATLKKAQAMAPALVEDVRVEVIGANYFEFRAL